MDINALKKRLGQLQITNNRTSNLWKPSPGTTQVRIVPYKFNKDNPFIELFFHYDLGRKSYLSGRIQKNLMGKASTPIDGII